MADEAIQNIVDAGLSTAPAVVAPVIPDAPDPTAPIQGGQNGPAAGSFQPNDGSFQSNFQVQPAHYMQNNPPQQRDFYADPEVRQFANGGVVAHSAQIPFAVLANRQNELDRQKAENAKAIAAFDPYAGIGKAAPQYQPAFGNAARGDLNSWINMVAHDRYGGDLKKAYLGIQKDPDLNRTWKSLAAKWNDTGIANQQYVKDIQSTVTDVYALNKQLPPDKMKVFQNYLAAVDDKTGAPIQGTNINEFIPKMRAAEAALSQTKYMTSVMTPLADKAMQQMAVDGKLTYDPSSGKYLIKSTDSSTLTDFRDRFVEKGLQDQIWPDKAAAQKDIDAFFKDKIKITTKTENPVPPHSSSSDAKSKYGTSYDYAAVSAYPFTSDVKTDQAVISDITSGKGGTAEARSFVTDQAGNTATIIPERFARDAKGNLFIVGKDANYKRADVNAKSPANTFKSSDVVNVGTVKDGWKFLGGTAPDGTEDNDASVKENWIQVADKGGPKTVVVPYNLNEGRVSTYWDGLTKGRIESVMDEGHANRLKGGQSQTQASPDFTDLRVQDALAKAGAEKGKKYTADDWNNASSEIKQKILSSYGRPQRKTTDGEAELAALPASDKRVQDAVIAASKATGREYDWTSEPRENRVAIMQLYGPKQ